MQLSIEVKRPYSFAQTVAFLRRFPPCQGDYVITDHSVTAAVSVRGIARAFTVHDGETLTVDVPRHADEATQRALLQRAADFIGANDDLTPLYAAAEQDAPFRAIVKQLHGLHHVRFLTLEEVALYCVLVQHNHIKAATAGKRRFLARFGIPIDVGGTVLRAMPELDQLGELTVAEIADAIDDPRRAEMITKVVRGLGEIGEPFLRAAPYAEARDALLAIPHIGPFSAAAILLRGLGRMDELPSFDKLESAARDLYGRAYDPAAIAARYGNQIGYWSFYVKAAA